VFSPGTSAAWTDRAQLSAQGPMEGGATEGERAAKEVIAALG
jgi:hypothetical protein